jgi:hypothetical protein
MVLADGQTADAHVIPDISGSAGDLFEPHLEQEQERERERQDGPLPTQLLITEFHDAQHTTAPPGTEPSAGAPVGQAVELFVPPVEPFDFAQRRALTVTVENILFTWGGIYAGEWAHDVPHGFGSIQLRNAQVGGRICSDFFL